MDVLRARVKTKAGVALMLIAGLAIAGVLAMMARGRASDPSAIAIHNGLQDFATFANTLASIEQLQQDIPLGTTDPAQALGLNNLVAQVFAALPVDPNTYDDVAGSSGNSLKTRLEGLDGTYGPAVAVTVGCSGSTSCATPVRATETVTAFDLEVPVRAVKDIVFPVAVDTANLDLNGGLLTFRSTLNTTLRFRYLKDGTIPSLSRFGVLPSNLSFTLGTPPGPGQTTSFNALFGVAAVNATTTVTDLSGSVQVATVDPDATDGMITNAEWDAELLSTLVSVTPAGNFSASLQLDTNLLPASPDVSTTVSDALADGFQFPAISDGVLGGLADFDNLTSSDILSGLTQLAGALGGLASQGNLEIPFLETGMSDVVNLAKPIIDMIGGQSDAVVVCGTAPNDPPFGGLLNVASSNPFYCQALTAVAPQPGSGVTWTATGATISGNGGNTNTVGVDPTANVSFTATSSAPKVTVTFVDNAGQTRSAIPRFQTAQDLLNLLKNPALGGFSPTSTALSYDSSRKALTYSLVKSFPSTNKKGGFSFGDQLEDGAGIRGLGARGTAGATVTASDVDVNLTFGVLLTPNVADIQPADNSTVTPTVADRFFLQVRNGASQYEFKADASVIADLRLKGMIGFVEVLAEGDPTAAPSSDPASAFSLRKRDGDTSPMLAVDINTPAAGVPISGAPAVPNAILIRDLLSSMGGTVSSTASATDTVIEAAVNAQISGGLAVRAVVSGRTLATGTVTLDWDDITMPSEFLVTRSAEFDRDLLSLNIDVNNPMALLSLLLDTLESISTAMEGFAGGNAILNEPLPLVGFSANDMVTRFGEVRRVVDELKGAPTAPISCGTTAAVTDTVTDVPDGATIYCKALNDRPVTNVKWTVDGSTGGLTNSTNINTFGTTTTATASFAVAVDDGNDVTDPGGEGDGFTTLGDDFIVHVEYTDTAGTHSSDLPALSPPPTLQRLERLLEAKLGLPSQAFNFQVGNVTPPGGGTPYRALTAKLGYGICTKSNDALADCDSSSSPLRDEYQSINKPEAPMNFELGNVSGTAVSFVGLEGNGSFDLEFLARASLDLAVALDPSATVTVLDSTGVSATAFAGTNDLNVTATVGPLTLAAGEGASATETSVAKAGFSFKIKPGDGADGNEAFAVTSTPSAYGFDPEVTGTAQSCGPDPQGAGLLDGHACARFGIKLGNTFLGTLGFRAEDVTQPDNLDDYPQWYFSYPPDLGDRILNALLDWDLILQAIPPLLDDLAENLNGAASDVQLPLIGEALDAGADVVNKVNEGFFTPLANLGTELKNTVNTLDIDGDGEAGAAGDIGKWIEDNIVTATTGANILYDWDGNGTKDAADVTVTVMCGASACASTATALSIDDVRVTFYIGQGNPDPAARSCTSGCVNAELPFDVGLDGLPLRATGALQAQAGWRLLVDFGLNRSGPYLKAGGAGHGVTPSEPELKVGASVSLGDAPNPSDCSMGVPDALDTVKAEYSSTRCLAGELAFIKVQLLDGNTGSGDSQRSGINVGATLQITAPGDTMTLGNLLSGEADFDPDVTADARLNLFVRTGFNAGAGSPALPSILGTFHLNWSPTAGLDKLEFNDLYLDLGTFVNQFLGPILSQVKKITSPLMPIIDTLQAPLPVVSDLAALVGQPPVTLFGLMKAISNNDLALVDSIIQFVRFINNVPSQSAAVPLGSFTMDQARAKAGPVSPDQADQLVASTAGGPSGTLVSQLSQANYTAGSGADDRPTTFGVKGLEFPFLNSGPRPLFDLMMGKDITIVRFDFGKISATAGFSYSFGPIMVGPIPISITLGGEAGVEARFALGYDTYGLRNGNLLLGIFIDDLDRNGADVPEVKFFGEVFAGAAVDLVIVSAGVEGGIRLTVNLNLNDSPVADGKLRADEVISKLSNPICLFDVSGALDAFLRAYVEVDLFFYSEKFSITIVEVRLLDFEGKCQPPTPKLAEVEGGNLVLNIGDRASRRNIAVDEVNEEMVVRQINPNAQVFSVAGFGIVQEFAGVSGQIIANAANGDDKLTFEPGTQVLNSGATQTVFFSKAVNVDAGADNDFVKGGDGADSLSGGPGNDQIQGGKGNDTLNGNDNDDALYGELGNDTAYGGTGNDRMSGGPGADNLFGEGDNDDIQGGPGSQKPSGGSIADGPNPDTSDLISGGQGSDSLQGNFYADFIFGDDVTAGLGGVPALMRISLSGSSGIETACGDTGSGADDIITGGDGDDLLFGGGGNDRIFGVANNDTLCGNAGNDFLEGDDTAGPFGNDKIYGNDNNDQLFGRNGTDELYGGAGNDLMLGGGDNDDLLGGGGRDVIKGEAGNDLLLGDNGSFAPHAATAHDSVPTSTVGVTVSADADSGTASCSDTIYTEAGGGTADCIFGGTGNDQAHGGGGADQMYGDDGMDYMEGNTGNDDMRGGAADDLMHGNVGLDVMNGDTGNDTMFGGLNRDTMRGSVGDDHVEGNGGADDIFGDAGQDNLIGGSSTMAGAGDGAAAPVASSEDSEENVSGTPRGDLIYGGSDHDWAAGDNASITPSTATDVDGSYLRAVTLHPTTLATAAGRDEIHGELGNDRIFGQNADDNLNGEDGDDFIWGNQGDDTLNGAAGQDDLIGGNGIGTAGDGAGLVDESDAADANDTINGGASVDFVLGDNGRIARPTETVSGTAQWVVNGFNSAVDRVPYPHDVAVVDPVSGLVSGEAAGSAGADVVHGNEAEDFIYGQGGGDSLYGDASDDYIEGNAGIDTIEGGEGGDDILGGTGLINGETTGVNGRADSGDNIYGQNGFDYITGDNAVVERFLNASGAWVNNTYNGGIKHLRINLLDVATTTITVQAATSGGDTIEGGGADDVIYGQGGNDTIDGQAGDDYAEGNANAATGRDVIRGSGGNDDLLGGSGIIKREPAPVNGRLDGGDDIFGGTGFDVISGDNAVIARTLSGTGLWQPNGYNAGVRHDRIWLMDVATTGNTAPESNGTSGQDTIEGNGADDVIYGQGAGDTIHGDDATYDDYTSTTAVANAPGHDDVEGNAGGDQIYGDEGEDNLVGGTGRINDDPPAGVNNRLDGDDVMRGDRNEQPGDLGGDDKDVMTGDNAIVTRDPNNFTAWETEAVGALGTDFVRTVKLLDLDFVTTTAVDADVHGNDDMFGNGGRDRMWGQGGRDCMKGGDHQDFMWGNGDIDWMEGNEDQDDIIGGSDIAHQRDEGDFIWGGGATDVILGDNGIITRDESVPGGPYYYEVDRLSVIARWVDLHDLESAAGDPSSPYHAELAGRDQISGGTGDDFAFGQDESDWISGGPESDYLEGNHGSDFVFGDRSLAAAATVTQVVDAGPIPAVATVAPEVADCATADDTQLNGPAGRTDGQDDIIGGSSLEGHRDSDQTSLIGFYYGDRRHGPTVDMWGDFLFGDGAADFMIGDNGTIARVLNGAGDKYITYSYNVLTLQRRAVRYDVGGPAHAFGSDYMEGNDGDDYMWGQDGDDFMRGNNDNDDMYGELGDDEMYGDDGEDAMLGDRGAIATRRVPASEQFTINPNGPPFVSYTAFADHPLDRRFDLRADGDGDPTNDPPVMPGLTHGGDDFMRGGMDHDSMHGAFEDDLMNGDSGGDYLFGDDGADVMWGGKGNNDPANLTVPGRQSESGDFVDYLFGGHGANDADRPKGSPQAADILDFRPRPAGACPIPSCPDPAVWFDITDTGNDPAVIPPGVDPLTIPEIADNQHHQGIDWIYGGWDRDIMQGDVAANGPNGGDRMWDWTGTYNLWTHCNAAYGGWNDIRAQNPTMDDFLHRLAYAVGVGTSVADTYVPTSSAYRELAYVFHADVKQNNGKNFPTTPGHFDQVSCSP